MIAFSVFCLVSLAQIVLSSKGIATPGPRDRLNFFSRPDLKAPTFELEVFKPEHVAPGYYFFSPWEQNYIQNGPYVYDSDGQLVWSGVNSVGGGNTHGIHVCDYAGQPHLCFYQGNQVKGSGNGHGLIFDTNYRLVKEIKTGGGRSGSDFHEFHLLERGNKALFTVYEPVPVDLADYNSTGFDLPQLGWVREAGFQEIDTRTDQVTFSWRSLEHIALPESEVPFNHNSGASRNSPWDYLHLNSVDKFSDGDYLVSGRHTSTIYKICGRSGKIVWRFGGSRSDFKAGFSISRQHHARVQFESERYTDISLFDNGRGKTSRTAAPSFGALIRLDHQEKSATLLHEYIRGLDCVSQECKSDSQGSMEVMPGSGNVLVGWGEQSYISEHLQETGEIVLRGKIAGNHVANYRASKGKWTGKPLDQPAIWSYSLSNESSTMVYVSWNGDTETASWRVYGGDSSDATALQGTGKRTGFETLVECSSSLAYAYADALDAQGNILSRSPVRRTFLPGPNLSKSCNARGCPMSLDWPNIENKVTMPWLAFVDHDDTDGINGTSVHESGDVASDSDFLSRMSRPDDIWTLSGGFLVIAMAFAGLRRIISRRRRVMLRHKGEV